MTTWERCHEAPATPWERCDAAPASEWERRYPLVPVLDSLVPASGVEASTVPVVLTGRFFTPDSTVQVSGAGVTVQNLVVVDHGRIECDLVIENDAAATERAVTVTTPGGTTASQPFTVVAIPAPTLDAIDPAAGDQGDTVPVTLTGTGFRAESTVQVSGAGVAVQNVVVVDSTEITCELVIDSGAAEGARDVTVMNDGGVSNAVSFEVESSAFILDSLTGASGTLMTAHVGEIGAIWTLQAGVNQGRLSGVGSLYNSGTGETSYRASGVPPSVDYEIEAEFRMLSAMIGANDGMDLHIRAGERLFALFFSNAAQQWQLYRNLGGGPVLMRSSAANLVTTVFWPTMTLRGVGREITVLNNGVVDPLLSFTDDGDSLPGFGQVRLFNQLVPSTNNSKLHFGPIVARPL